MCKLHGFARTLAAGMLGTLLACAALAQPATQKSCAELRNELAGVAPVTVLNRLSPDCLGGDMDADAAARRVQRLFATAARVEGQPRTPAIRDVTLSAEERKALALAVLRAADDSLATVHASAAAVDKAEVERLRADVQLALRERVDGVQPGPPSRVLRMEHWSWDGSDREQPLLGGTGIDVSGMFKRAGCDAAPRGTACAATLATAEGLLRGAQLALRSFVPDQMQAIQSAEARAAVRDTRWRSYFADARSQYPWELFVNSLVYESKLRSNLGISGPPNWQWIVLHPDIGMQYVRDAARGERFQPALVLELIGYNRWTWGADNKPQNAWGVSLVRTYADTASVPTSAWGIAIHRNNKYSLTLTRRDGNTGVLLSLDLAGAVTKASQEWSDKFRIGD